MNADLEDFIEAAGLLKYDPSTIAKIYQGHPGRLLNRLIETLVPLGLFLLGVSTDRLLGLLKDSKKARARAQEFSDLLVQLGPAFIKAGQALSTRPDVIPTVLLDELAQLQDQLPGFDSDLAMACIEEDLGTEAKLLFKSIEKDPISAASLGQVHQAIFKDGTKVAVKVQRPGLREQITLDLYIVRNIASFANKYIGLIRSDLVALIDELGKRVFEEMDYLNEASNAEKFKLLHAHNKKIMIPQIYREATTRRVLTMEWIEGVKLTNLKAVRELGINPDKMIEIGVNCSLQQLLEHGFFHADPHPGNLLALEDGRLSYLDFGMMSEVSREARTGLIQAVVHLVNKNFEKLSSDFVSLGFLSETVDLAPIVPAFEKVFSQALEQGVEVMDFKSVTDDLSGVMYKFPFQVPPYYALIIRSLITLEGIALSVDPDFKILGAAYPYFAKRLIEDPDPSLRKSLKEMIYDGKEFKWVRLEELVKSAAIQSNLDIGAVIDQLTEVLFSKKGGVMREKLVNVSINKIDNLSWRALRKAKKIASSPLDTIKRRKDWNIKSKILLEFEPIRQMIKVLRHVPGFGPELILKKIPKMMSETNARKMGIDILKGVTEKSMVRVIKKAAGTKEKKQ